LSKTILGRVWLRSNVDPLPTALGPATCQCRLPKPQLDIDLDGNLNQNEARFPFLPDEREQVTLTPYKGSADDLSKTAR
jgi:hypothetical protein